MTPSTQQNPNAVPPSARPEETPSSSPGSHVPATEGQTRARGNALQHGLCATTLLPEVLGNEVLRQHKINLRSEWQPTSPTQEFLVNELARHAAALERVEQVEAAVLRCGARGVSDVFALQALPPDTEEDLVLAGAATSEALDRVTRYRRAHEKGWHATLGRLQEAKAAETRAGQLPAALGTPAFAAEAACEAYLLQRWQRGDRPPCPCGRKKAYWLAQPRRWQCAGCHRQFSLRSGTVMERSPLPLTLWFAAIQVLVQDPAATVAALAAATGHRRRATLGSVARKIRAAQASDRASTLLAGLDQVFWPRQLPRPEPGVPETRILRNEAPAAPGALRGQKRR